MPRQSQVRKTPTDAKRVATKAGKLVGDREVEAGQVSVREHRKGDEGAVAVDEFAERLARETAERSA